MDLFELSAKLKLDDSSFNRGIESANNAGAALGQRMNAITVAAGQIAADVVRKAASAISGVVTGAIDSYADYQQLIGGVETLFKNSAGTVANYAKQSFKTTGLSANDYMETVTSFSASLMQGLKGDTEAAAELANLAVTDMADNANKMGTDMTSIQNAYMGFAKQNYTMLDNLKLGYGGTKEEMLRLVNDSGVLGKKVKSLDDITFDQLILAIHAIQTQMGITGTTAEEAAETISGSKASLKAAWGDFLSAVGGEGNEERLQETATNFKEAFSTYMGNLLPSLVSTIANSDTLVDTLADAITGIPTQALAQIAQGGFDLVGSGFDAATKIGEWAITAVVDALKEINVDPSHLASMGESIGNFVGTTLVNLITNAPDIVGGLINAGVTLAGSLITGLIQGLQGENSGLSGVFAEADRELSQGIREATRSATEAEGIITYMEGLVAKYGEAATGTSEWNSALERLEQVLPGAKEFIDQSNDSLATTVSNLRENVQLLKEKAIEEAKQKALQTKREAYYQAVTDLGAAQGEIDYNQSIIDSGAEKLIDYIMKYQPKDSETTAEDYRQLSTDDLIYTAKSVLANYGPDMGTEEYDTALAEITGIGTAMAEAQGNVETLTGNMESLQQQVDQAGAMLALAEQATSRAAGETDALATAAATAATTLATIKAPNWGTGDTGGRGANTGETWTPNATGLDWVPYNGYRAELHRGEAVLTAAQNQAYRNGGMDYNAMGGLIGEAVEAAMGRVGVYLNGDKMADMTSRRTGKNINQTTNSRLRGMGG